MRFTLLVRILHPGRKWDYKNTGKLTECQKLSRTFNIDMATCMIMMIKQIIVSKHWCAFYTAVTESFFDMFECQNVCMVETKNKIK